MATRKRRLSRGANAHQAFAIFAMLCEIRALLTTGYRCLRRLLSLPTEPFFQLFLRYFPALHEVFAVSPTVALENLPFFTAPRSGV